MEELPTDATPHWPGPRWPKRKRVSKPRRADLEQVRPQPHLAGHLQAVHRPRCSWTRCRCVRPYHKSRRTIGLVVVGAVRGWMRSSGIQELTLPAGADDNARHTRAAQPTIPGMGTTDLFARSISLTAPVISTAALATTVGRGVQVILFLARSTRTCPRIEVHLVCGQSRPTHKGPGHPGRAGPPHRFAALHAHRSSWDQTRSSGGRLLER